MDDNRIGRLMFDKQLAAKATEAKAEAKDLIVTFFRQLVVEAELTTAQTTSAEVLIKAFPAEWDEAKRQGPLGERWLRGTYKLH